MRAFRAVVVAGILPGHLESEEERMREILFKAQRNDTKEWVEGYIFGDGMSNSSRMFVGEIVISDCKGCSFDKFNIDGISFYEVDPETVGQYTGLTDKNGKKIFEGDIVDMSNEEWNASGTAGHETPVEAVKWDDPTAGFFPFANYDCDCGVFICASKCEVIGNIHDKEDKSETI